MPKDDSHLLRMLTEEPLGPPPAAASVVDPDDQVQHYPEPGLRPVNVRFVVGLVSVVLVVSVGIWGLHRYQMQSMSTALLERSQHSREAGDLEGSVQYLRDYLRMVPGDTDALQTLTSLLDDAAENPQQRFEVLQKYEELFRRQPNNADVRRKLIDLSIYFGRYSDAIEHLQALLSDSPGDGELYIELGGCYEAIHNPDEAIAAYKSATEVDPRAFEAYERLVALVRERHAGETAEGAAAGASSRTAEVDRMLDQLVRVNRDSFQAYVLRARAKRMSGQFQDALRDARRAWQLAPDEIDTLLLAADLITEEGQTTVEDTFRIEDVETRLRAAVAREPQNARLHHALAKLDIADGQPAAAVGRLRAGLQTDPANIDLRLLLADVLVNLRDFEGAQEEIAELARRNAPRPAIEFLQARLAMAQDDWLAARGQLELAATGGSGDLRFRVEVHLLLARCYGELGQTELEIATYERALRIWDGSADARIGLARALAEAGRLDEALSHYDRVLHVAGVPAAVARLRIEATLQRPESERNWSDVEDFIDELARNRGSEVESLVLRAELEAARGEPERSLSPLRNALDRQRGRIELWLALADLELRAGRREAAVAVIEQAERELGSRPELLIARIRLAAAGDVETTRRELFLLESRVGEISDPDRLGVVLELASAYEESGETDSAMRNWKRAAELEPNHLAIRLRMLGLAVRTGAVSEVAENLTEIRRIEGADGFYSCLSEAAYCMLRVRQGDRSLLMRARRLIEKADRLPAGSPARVQLAFAELCELDGNEAMAVEHYRRAIELGERSPAVVERAVRILYDRHRFAAAERLIDAYQQRHRSPIAGEFGRLAAEVSLRAQNRQQAIERARQAASADSGDFEDHLWLGRLLADAGRVSEAEAAFRRARELAPTRPDVWISSVRFAARHGRREDVAQLLEEVATHVPADALPPVLAQCYEASGDLTQAKEKHREIIQSRPDHGPSLWAASSFLIRTGNANEAEPLLRRLLSDDAANHPELQAPARRALAAVVASGGTYRGFQEAVGLLEQNLSAAPGSEEDLLIKARMLAARPERRCRQEAVALFESLDERSRLALEDMRSLIQLHMDLGEWERARLLLQALLAARPNDPDVLEFAIRAMIDHGETGEATQQRLSTLRTVQHRDPELAAELEARLLIARGSPQEGVEVLRQWLSSAAADDPLDGGERQGRIARILAEVSLREEALGRATAAELLAKEAERLYRGLLERRSDETLALARFLARRWQTDEAVTLCERAWGHLPAEQVASACVEVLREGRPEPEHFQRIVERIADAAHTAAGSAGLQFHLANAAHLQGDYALAERSYRRVLELSPGSVVARNELALLLALQRRNTDEALELINGAIQAAGPLPALLDTRATVHLAAGRPEAAVRDLDEAVRDTPTPVRRFHLAQALLADGDADQARAAFREGIAAGLHEGSLHPLERSGFRQLQSQMQKL